MILTQDTFVCKPGKASKLAKLFKEVMQDNNVKYILTDMTGQYNRVIMISEFESLSDYEKSMEKYMNPTPEMADSMKKMEGYTDMYKTGSREILKVW